MTNTKKKVLVIALAVCLLSVASLGTLAWFSASDTVTNNFYIANSEDDPDDIFSVDVWEDDDKTDVDGEDKIQDGIDFDDILPGDKLFKEVHIENTGYYDQYVRATVTVSGASVWQDVFGMFMVPLTAFVDTIDTNAIYTTVSYYDAVNDTFIYELYYTDALAAGKEIIVFDTVKISEDMDRFQAADLSGEFYINVIADAVQTENVGTNVYEAFKTVGLLTDVPCDVLANPETIADILATAAPGTVIGLEDGVYESITLTQDNLTIVAKNAMVGYVNANAKDNCRLIGLTFDAAGAKEAYNGKGTALGIYTNIDGAKTNSNGADNLQILACDFVGTPADAENFVSICFYERNRASGGMIGATISGCSFETDAAYYIYMYYPGYKTTDDFVITNNTFGTATTTVNYAVYVGSTQGDVTVSGNTFVNSGVVVTPHNNASCTYALDIVVTDNDFTNTATEALTAIGLRDFHSLPKCTTTVTGNTANGGTATLGDAYIDASSYECYDVAGVTP